MTGDHPLIGAATGLLQHRVQNNSVGDYMLAVAIMVVGFFIARKLKNIFDRHFVEYVSEVDTSLFALSANFIRRNALPLLYFITTYVAVESLAYSDKIGAIIRGVWYAIFMIFMARFLSALAEHALKEFWKDKEATLKNAWGIVTLVKAAVWGFIIVFALDNLGFQISSVITGIGISGVALALASQNILGDLFNYFVILFDKPFAAGDFIMFGNYAGTVERFGIKTTRIKSLDGEEIVVSNTYLTGSQVRNFKKMEQRRVIFKLGVTYQTSYEKMREIPALIESIIRSERNTAFDRSHFSEYGDSALIIETVYFVTGSDYNQYMDTQQNVNFRIMEAFAQKKIEFAYPTRTLFIQKPEPA